MNRRSDIVAGLLLLVAGCLAASCGKNAEQFLASGDGYYKAKRYPEAIIQYRNAVEKDPELPAARQRLADAYMAAQDGASAGEQYLKAADLLPHDVDAQLKAASMLLLAKRFEEARNRTQAILRENPKNITAQVIHANAMAGLKQFDRAQAEIERAISLDPTRSSTYTNLGVLQMATGAAGQSEAALKKAVEVSPNSAAAHLMLGTYYWSSGRFSEAEGALKRANQLDPKLIGANRALATFYLGTNRQAEAEKQLKAIVDTAPSVPASLALADYYVAMKRAAEAVPILEAVTKQKDGYGEARSRLAALAFGAGRRAEAYKLIDDTLAHDPVHPRALLTKSEFLVAEHKYDEALVPLKTAVIANPRSAPAHFALGSIYAIKRQAEDAEREFREVLKVEPGSQAAQIELARLSLAGANPDDAAEFAEQAVMNSPSSINARVILVRSLLAQGDVKRAEAVLKPLLAPDLKLASAQALAGAIHVRKNEAAPARQSFERALALDPNALEAISGLVALDLSAGRKDAAISTIEAYVARRPTDVAGLALAARTYHSISDLGREETLLRKAIALEPANPDLYSMLGQIYVSQKRLDRAVQEFEAMAAQDPKSQIAHTMVAVLFDVQGNVAEAQQRYRKVLQLNPRSAVAANNLAWLYAEQGGDLDQALQLAQIAREQRPDDPAVNDTLGWVYYRKDQPATAIAPLKACIEAAPKNPFCHYHLGLVYVKTGAALQAKEALQTALQISSTFDGASDARVILASLR